MEFVRKPKPKRKICLPQITHLLGETKQRRGESPNHPHCWPRTSFLCLPNKARRTQRCRRGDPKLPEECVGINTYLFLHIETSVTFKVLSISCNTPTETFFPLLKTVFELIDFDAF